MLYNDIIEFLKSVCGGCVEIVDGVVENALNSSAAGPDGSDGFLTENAEKSAKFEDVGACCCGLLTCESIKLGCRDV